MPPKDKEALPEGEDTRLKTQKLYSSGVRESQLQNVLSNLTDELKNMRIEVENLFPSQFQRRHENDFLQEEAQQTRLETHEYLAYVSKKTQKRQSAVVSLSDRNAEHIKEIQKKKEELMQKYYHEKEKLGKVLLSREAELKNINKDLEEMNAYRVLQLEQQAEIAQLEKRVSEMRMKHNEAIQKLKAKFLEQKNEFYVQSEDHLQELSKEAKKEAQVSLRQHSQKIKEENRSLRKELLELIRKTRALHAHKLELVDQKKILLREKQYATNLQILRQDRLLNMYDAYSIPQHCQNDSK